MSLSILLFNRGTSASGKRDLKSIRHNYMALGDCWRLGVGFVWGFFGLAFFGFGSFLVLDFVVGFFPFSFSCGIFLPFVA